MDANANEYAAAVAGMQETYGSDRHADAYAVGDHVTFRLRQWGDRSYDDGRVIDHRNGRLLVETASDVHEVDPRPWPTGNVLPF
jgi:hypothetical protein